MSSPKHSFHLVDESPWPILVAFSAFTLAIGLLNFFWEDENKYFLLVLSIFNLILFAGQWWRDISYEATYQGLHTSVVEVGLRWGMMLFIVSEVCFFFSFFWAYFYVSVEPSMELGGVWPPLGVVPFNPWGVPLLNTIVLLSSGLSITWSHHALMVNKQKESAQGLLLTIMLGLYFSCLQGWEYYEASFSMADSVFGSTFFITTGFHGLHVLVGTSFLMVCYVRLVSCHFSSFHHLGYEAAAWYWHFVDVVWLFLYISVYWGSSSSDTINSPMSPLGFNSESSDVITEVFPKSSARLVFLNVLMYLFYLELYYKLEAFGFEPDLSAEPWDAMYCVGDFDYSVSI